MTIKTRRFAVLLMVVGVLALSVTPAFAQWADPDAPTAAELLTDSVGILGDLGVMPIIFAGAIVGAGVFLLRRVKSGAR